MNALKDDRLVIDVIVEAVMRMRMKTRLSVVLANIHWGSTKPFRTKYRRGQGRGLYSRIMASCLWSEKGNVEER